MSIYLHRVVMRIWSAVLKLLVDQISATHYLDLIGSWTYTCESTKTPKKNHEYWVLEASFQKPTQGNWHEKLVCLLQINTRNIHPIHLGGCRAQDSSIHSNRGSSIFSCLQLLNMSIRSCLAVYTESRIW